MAALDMEEKLKVAALLHDIGKLVRRAGISDEAHYVAGSEFLENFNNLPIDADVLDFIISHHYKSYGQLSLKNEGNKKWLDTLIEADHITAGQRRTGEEKHDELGTGLACVFSDDFEKQYVPMLFSHPYWKECYKQVEREYVVGFAKFYRDMFKKSMVNFFQSINKNASFEVQFRNLLEIMRELGAFVTDNTQKGANKVPLYDHSKMTSAIVTAIYRTEKIGNEKKFLIIAGDFTGIQGFIKGIPPKAGEREGGLKGYTKRIRGRSFLLQLLTEVFVEYILKKLGLSRDAVIYAAGGNFEILAPNTSEARDKLSKIRENIQSLLLDYTHTLGFALAWVEASGDDFVAEKGKKLKLARALSYELTKAKRRQYADDLEGLYKALFEDARRYRYKCNYCEEPLKEEEDKCDFCKLCEALGTVYPRKKLYLVISKEELEVEYKEKEKFLRDSFEEINKIFNEMFKELGLHVYLVPDIDWIEKSKEKEVYLFAFRSLPEKTEKNMLMEELEAVKDKNFAISVRFKPNFYIGDLEKLGGVKLAHVSLDVDGLGERKRETKNLAEYSAIATQLEAFFGKHMCRIVEEISKEKKRGIYCVFLGGDDIYIIARADVGLEFAKRVREDLDKMFFGTLGISGAIAFFNHKYPIKRAVEITQELENKGKGLKNKLKGRGKNTLECSTINIFGFNFSWDAYLQALTEADELKNNVNTAFLHRIYRIVRNDKLSISKKKYLLSYQLARNVEKDSKLWNTLEQLIGKSTFEIKEKSGKIEHEERVFLLLPLLILLNRNERAINAQKI